MTVATFAAESRARTVLEVRQDGVLVRTLPVTRDSVVIGRREGVDCRLEHETVSRLHAVIYREPGGPWRVRDLGSHNGTYIGPKRINQELLSPEVSAGVGVFELRLVRTIAAAAPITGPDDPPTADPPTDDHATGDHLAVGRTTNTDDRTVSLVRAALEAEVSDALRAQLTDLARRVRVTESTIARRRQLCEFLTRCQDLDVTTATVITGPRIAGPEGAAISVCVPAGDPPPPDEGPWGPLVSAVLDRWQPVRGPADNSAHHADATSLGSLPALEAVACPLTIDSEDNAEVLIAALGPVNTPRTRELIVLAARQYAEALEEAASLDLREEYRSYRDQIRVAEQIQRSLIPRSPGLPGLDVALVSAPSERVSGDYLDAFAIDDNRSLVILADVTGHGLGAAIVAAQVHTMVHAHAWDRDADLAGFVRRVSRYLCRFTPDNITVTALAALHDRSASELQLVNAGHHPVLILDSTGVRGTTRAGVNALLGLEHFADDPLEVERIPLAPDTWVVGYTDGVPEQRNAEGIPLGHGGAAEIIAAAIANPHTKPAHLTDAPNTPINANDIAQRVGLGLDSHQGFAQQSDDRSIFVLRESKRDP